MKIKKKKNREKKKIKTIRPNIHDIVSAFNKKFSIIFIVCLEHVEWVNIFRQYFFLSHRYTPPPLPKKNTLTVGSFHNKNHNKFGDTDYTCSIRLCFTFTNYKR